MKVIILKRPKEHGKSETLKKLYSLLIAEGAENIADPKDCVLCTDDKEYFLSLNGIKIAIVTLGDYRDELMWHIGYYDASHADVLIIAERTEARAVEKKSHHHNYTTIVIDNELSNNMEKHTEENHRDCLEILNEINNIV